MKKAMKFNEKRRHKIAGVRISMLLVSILLMSLLCGCAGEAVSSQESRENVNLTLIEDSEEASSEESSEEILMQESEQMETEANSESEEEAEGASEAAETAKADEKNADSAYVNADGSFKNGSPYTAEEALKLRFRKKSNLDQHYEKHGIEMGFEDEIAYRDAAAAVVANPKALHKLEKEDQDDVYYIEETNEFVVVSSDGYLRTYFNPSSGIKYYNRQ